MKSGKSPTFLWRIFFGSLLLSSLLAILDIRNLALDKGFSLTQPKWLGLIIVIAFMGIFALILFVLTWTKGFEKIKVSFDAFLHLGENRFAGWSALFLFFLSLFSLPAFISHPYLGSLFSNRLWIKLLLFLLLTFFDALLLRVARIVYKKEKKTFSWIDFFLFAALSQLLVYQLFLASLYITDYPFAIGWTRDSRYYYASLFFAQKIYGQKLPLPILHPTLHFIFSFPFLFGKLPLSIHRAWSVILTLGLSRAVSFALRRKMGRSPFAIFFAVWTFLFLVQGSIYAHLLVPVLIIFLFVSSENPKRTWMAIIITSLWAGMSRINWFPVPAMLAALIYFLETPQEDKNAFQYLKLPTLWFIAGVSSAFAAQAAYIQLSGNGARGEFFTSLSSALLWYRLLPNATYPPGIIFGALLLSAPLIFLLFYSARRWQPLQKLGVFTILIVLFLGGLVVSVKIGGGADLHNMDAYFVSILLVGTTALAREFRLDSAPKLRWREMLFAATLLLGWFILHGSGSRGYDRFTTDAILNNLQAQVTRVAAQGDEVLFISQRHLLAVELIDVPLVPEYEKDVLMEMVMSKNKSYLDTFYDDLRHQRFGLIVVDPQKDSLVGEEQSFGAENNKWVLKVTYPLWCYYEVLETYPAGIELYVPLAEPMDCK